MRAFVFVAGVVAAAVLSPTASAGLQAAAPTTTSTTAKGEAVDINGVSTRLLPCADGSSGQEFTSFFVTARTNVTRAGSTRLSTRVVDLFVSTFESCGNTSELWSGSTDTPANLSVKTGSAALTATVPLVSQVTSSTRTANLSLTLTATEAPVRTRSNNTFMDAGTKIMFRDAGSLASDATVTGSVTVDGGQNLISGSANVFGSFGANRTTEMSVVQAQRRTPIAATATQRISGPQIAPTTTTSTADKGQQANVSAFKTAELTCPDGSLGEEFNLVIVIARTNVVRAGSTRQTVKAVEVLASTFETCGFTSRSLFGSTDSPSYTQKGADSAAVSGTLRLFDQFSGAPVGDVDLSLAVQAVEPAVRVRNRSMSTAPASVFMFRSDGMFSTAAATGTITINGGPNLLLGTPEVSAQLGTNTTSTLSVIRAPHRTP